MRPFRCAVQVGSFASQTPLELLQVTMQSANSKLLRDFNDLVTREASLGTDVRDAAIAERDYEVKKLAYAGVKETSEKLEMYKSLGVKVSARGWGNRWASR